MALHREPITVSGSTGGAGVSTATTTTDKVIRGWITAIYLEYTGSPPAATTDVTIAEAIVDDPQTILTITNGATDGWYYPLHQAQDETGTDLFGTGMPIIVADKIIATIAQANDDDGVIVTLIYET